MVVADDPRQRNLLRMHLERIGFEVSVAADGLTALDSLRFTPPDIVVCDIEMPEFTGEHFVMQMRQRPQFVNTPVIMLSLGSVEVGDSVRRLPLGPVEYFCAPIDIYALLARVEFYVSPPAPDLVRSLVHPRVLGA